MKRIINSLLLLQICFWGFLQLAAAPITQQQAQQNVQTFLESKGMATKASTLRLSKPKFTSSNMEYYYVFNIGDNDGYVIAAGDDYAPAILGYADSGSVDVDSMPENMKAWLEEYVSQIEYMQKNQLMGAPKMTTSFNAISPLLTTTWDQMDPYNQNCPDFFGYGRCVTGCVATAMAQVMYYYRANSVTQTTAQIPAYDCRTLWLNGSDTLGRIHVDAIPAGSPIDWGNMLDSYNGSSTTAQQQAVANLMKYCGASVSMNYATEWDGGSSAYSSDVPIALKTYFNYSDETVFKYRSDYSSQDAWESLIYNELSSSRPVYYSGRNSSGGHAFVCDGYDGSGYYHINWGWSGTSDGYFLLTALDPDQQGTGGSSSGYNLNQAAIINAQPKSSTPSNPVLATSITLNMTSATVTEGNTLQLTATVLPTNATNRTVTWKSSNTSVATVSSSGLVTAKSPGSATITATTSDGTNLSANCSVAVESNNPQSSIISFADAKVKALCVQNWDTNGDGELSTTEAAAVKNLGTVFKSDSTITSFDELQYFTGLRSIGDYAFNKCSGLTRVTLPNSVTSIGWAAFSGCSGLTGKLTIPNSVTSIGDYAFKQCSGLTGGLTIPNSVTSIGVRTFTECSGLTSVTIGNSVTSIGSSAFYNCSSLTSVTIGNSVTFIGGFAFYNCSSLTGELTIPNSVTSINDYSFAYCSGLTSVTIGNSVTTIGDMAFQGCSGLNRVNITDLNAWCNIQFSDNPLNYAHHLYLNGSEVTDLMIPNTVTSISNSAFSGCSGLTSVTIPNSVTSIGGAAFSGCSGLTGKLTIPNSVTSIGWSAFNGCSNLTSVTIPNSVTSIGGWAFLGCSGLTGALAIPNSLTSIGEKTFYNCSGLTSVTIPNSVIDIGEYAFYGCSGLTGALAIPNSLTSIGDRAFYGCSGLTSVTIPNSVTSIGDRAFSGCSGLNDVYSFIEDPTTVSMGSSVFYRYPNNYAVRKLHVPNSTSVAYRANTGWSQYFGSIVEMGIFATSITLNMTSATVTEGNTLQLTATVLPTNAANKTVTWTSSNTSVATVSSSGLVTAKSFGSAIITATTTDGTNLSATCVVTVAADLNNYDNYLSLNDVETFHGDTIVIPVSMTNAESIISFQTDIFLPDGLEIVQEDGDYLIDASERMTRTHSLMSNDVSSGAVRVLCYSSNYKPFTGNSGDDLFYITVKVADDAEGDYIIQLKNTLLTNTDFVDLAAPDVAANVNVKAYHLGDANNSGTVTITDVVVTAQYVLEMNPSPFIFAAADVNFDNNITVADVSRIVWMVLNPTLGAPRRAPALWNNGDRMSGEGITLTAGETRTVSIMLDNEMDYSAFQLDLTLPEGLTAGNFRLTDRAGSHAFDVNTLANGKTRALCYSPTLTAIRGNEGALLTFDVTATTAIDGVINVDGIELVTTDCQTVRLDAFAIGVNNATSMNEIAGGKTVARVDYFNLAGQQIDRPESGVTLVVTTYTDGTRTTTKVIQ